MTLNLLIKNLYNTYIDVFNTPTLMKELKRKFLILIYILIKFYFKRLNFIFIKGSDIYDISNSKKEIFLYDLNLYENCGKNIPVEFSNGLKPINIILCNRNLNCIPPEIKLFKNLIRLNLCNNFITNLCELPISLKCILIVNNKLKFLPEHFFNLINLETIELKKNLLSEFPKSMEKFINLKNLDLSYNKISELHSSIGELVNIEQIILSCNNIKGLPNSISNLTNVNFIDLSHNNLNEFPDNCENLHKLKELNLSCNSISDIKTICKIKSLETLFLYKNQISDISNCICNLENLIDLNLSKNFISELPKEILKCRKLKKLGLSSNSISNFKTLCQIKTLEALYLYNNQILEVPKNICNLENLKDLYLSENYISCLPEEISRCKKLINLCLSSNLITNIDIICNIKSLEVLFICNNRIKEIPDNISNLENLHYLNMSKNNISNISNKLKKCKKLKKLCLSFNLITKIEFICKIKFLENIFLSNNQISEIPNNIYNLENLAYLNLSGNKIVILPKEFVKCTKLKKLCLSNNSIKNLETICKIKGLEKLSLVSNQISVIPDNIYSMENLESLDLSKNNIFCIPEELNKCKKLKFLYLNKNKIDRIPIKLFSMLCNLDLLDIRENPIVYPADSTEIDILELKKEMGDNLIVESMYYKRIKELYDQLSAKPVRFNFINLRKCRSSTLPLHIYTEQELLEKISDWEKTFITDEHKTNIKINILDPNEFTSEVKSLDTTILIDFIHHLYNPKKEYHKWNVPLNLINDFKKYIGAIVYKLFSSTDTLFVEGHLNSLSTAFCYCPERQKSELIFLYEILINEDENSLEKFQNNSLNLKQGSNEHIENIKTFIEDTIKKFIGTIKEKMLMHIFNNSKNKQNVHLYNYWRCVLKDHIGLDFFGDKPELIGQDKFNGKIELGLYAYFEKFTPEWLISELKNLINNDCNLICKISEYLYYSDIQNKILFVDCEYDDVLFSKSVTIEFCEFVLKNMELIIVD